MNDDPSSIGQKGDSSIALNVFDTPVEIRPEAGLNLLALWAGGAVLAGRRSPERSWPERLAIGAVSAAIWVSADFGHALAHILSARAAEAPMDEVRISQVCRALFTTTTTCCREPTSPARWAAPALMLWAC